MNNKTMTDLGKLWSILTDGDSYLVPETVQDHLVLGPFASFTIGQTRVYAKPETRRVMADFVSRIEPLADADCCSRSTIGEVTVAQIVNHFSSQAKRQFKLHLEQIVQGCRGRVAQRVLVRRVRGLELEGLSEIHFGSWRLVTFDDNQAVAVLSEISGDERWKKDLLSLFRREFKGHACFIIRAIGDPERVTAKADRIARFVANTLRYGICIELAPENQAHKVGIQVSPSDSSSSFFYLQYRSDTGEASFSSDNVFRVPYPLTPERLKALQEDWCFDRLWSLIDKPQLSDIEAAVFQAVTWLGEAHQDSDRSLASIKYWTALEAMITGYQGGNETERLKTALPVLLSAPEAEPPSKNRVDKLYQRRSDLVHGRTTVPASADEVNTLCDWTTRCISLYLDLANAGYEKREDIYEVCQQRTTRRG